MSDCLLKIENLEKHFEGVKALDNFSCTVNQGEILGLIGPNGAGKTTLFNVIMGFITPDGGNVLFRGVDLLNLPPHRVAALGIGRTFQKLRLIRHISVLDNVLLAFKNQTGEQLRNVFFRWNASMSREAENKKKAISLLEQAGLTDKLYEVADTLSYGQQKLLSLTCCLASDANLLLFDEPVAGVAPEMIEKILPTCRSLAEHGKTVMLIEHNLDAVTQVCNRVIFMDTGMKVSEGTPEEVRNDPKIMEAYLD